VNFIYCIFISLLLFASSCLPSYLCVLFFSFLVKMTQFYNKNADINVRLDIESYVAIY